MLSSFAINQVKGFLITIILLIVILLTFGILEMWLTMEYENKISNLFDLWSISCKRNILFTASIPYYELMFLHDNKLTNSKLFDASNTNTSTSTNPNNIFNRNYFKFSIIENLAKVVKYNNQILKKISDYRDMELMNFYNEKISSFVLEKNGKIINKKERSSFLFNSIIIKIVDSLNIHTKGFVLQKEEFFNMEFSNFDFNQFDYSELYRDFFFVTENTYKGIRINLENMNSLFKKQIFIDEKFNIKIRLAITIIPFIVCILAYMVFCLFLSRINHHKIKILKIFFLIDTKFGESVINECNDFVQETTSLMKKKNTAKIINNKENIQSTFVTNQDNTQQNHNPDESSTSKEDYLNFNSKISALGTGVHNIINHELTDLINLDFKKKTLESNSVNNELIDGNSNNINIYAIVKSPMKEQKENKTDNISSKNNLIGIPGTPNLNESIGKKSKNQYYANRIKEKIADRTSNLLVVSNNKNTNPNNNSNNNSNTTNSNIHELSSNQLMTNNKESTTFLQQKQQKESKIKHKYIIHNSTENNNSSSNHNNTNNLKDEYQYAEGENEEEDYEDEEEGTNPLELQLNNSQFQKNLFLIYVKLVILIFIIFAYFIIVQQVNQTANNTIKVQDILSINTIFNRAWVFSSMLVGYNKILSKKECNSISTNKDCLDYYNDFNTYFNDINNFENSIIQIKSNSSALLDEFSRIDNILNTELCNTLYTNSTNTNTDIGMGISTTTTNTNTNKLQTSYLTFYNFNNKKLCVNFTNEYTSLGLKDSINLIYSYITQSKNTLPNIKTIEFIESKYKNWYYNVYNVLFYEFIMPACLLEIDATTNSIADYTMLNKISSIIRLSVYIIILIIEFISFLYIANYLKNMLNKDQAILSIIPYEAIESNNKVKNALKKINS